MSSHYLRRRLGHVGRRDVGPAGRVALRSVPTRACQAKLSDSSLSSSGLALLAQAPHRALMQSPPDRPKEPDKPTPLSQDEVREPPVPGEENKEEKFPRKGDPPDSA